MSDIYIEKLPILNSVFVPFAPIDSKDIFYGRARQIQKCVDAVTQRGRHIVLYGERGVGKTSFANIIRLIPLSSGCSVRLTCDTQDTVESLWKKVFDRILIKSIIHWLCKPKHKERKGCLNFGNV